MDDVVVVGTVSNTCVLHTAAAGPRFVGLIVPADGISALTNVGQPMMLRLVSWLYIRGIGRHTEEIAFTDVVAGEVPRRESEWCWRPTAEALAARGPQEARIAELEAELCQRAAVITGLKNELQGGG